MTWHFNVVTIILLQIECGEAQEPEEQKMYKCPMSMSMSMSGLYNILIVFKSESHAHSSNFHKQFAIAPDADLVQS